MGFGIAARPAPGVNAVPHCRIQGRGCTIKHNDFDSVSPLMRKD